MPDVVLISVIQSGSTDVQQRVGGPVFASSDMSSADQDSIEGNGTWLRPLQGTGGGGGSVNVAANGEEVVTGATELDLRGGVAVASPSAGVARIAPSVQSFMFRPGSSFSGPIVWGDFAELYAALDTTRTMMQGDAAGRGGAFEILFCGLDNAGDVSIPAGTYDMTNVAWRGFDGNGGFGDAPGVEVELEADVLITKLHSITDMRVFTTSDNATIRLSPLDTLTLTRAIANSTLGKSVITVNTADSVAVLRLSEESLLGTLGAEPLPCVNVVAGSFFTVNLDGGGAFIAKDAISGGGATTINVNSAGADYDEQTQLGANSEIRQNTTNRYNIATQVVLTDPTSTLPLAAAFPGLAYVIKGDGQSVEVTPTGGDTIDGADSITIGDGQAMIFLSDGVDQWRVIASYVTGAAGSSAVFTYRPSSGLAGPAVFEDFGDLYAALNASRAGAGNSGGYQIVFDDSAAPGDITVPAGTYDMSGVEFVGTNAHDFGPEPVRVLLDDGVNITHLSRITNLNLSTEAQSAIPITMGNLETLTIENGTVQSRFARSIVRVTANALIILLDNAVFGTSGEPTPVCDVDAGASLQVWLSGGGCGLSPNAFRGDGGVEVRLYTSGTLYVNQQGLTNPAFVSTQVQNYYNPSQIWSDPGVFLSSVAQLPPGFVQVAKNAPGSGQTQSIFPNGDDTIDGVNAPFAVAEGESVIIEGDGISNWKILAWYSPGLVNTLTLSPAASVNGPYVFTSWADLYSALVSARAAAQGSDQFTILIQDPGIAEVPAGAYDLSRCTLAGTNRGYPYGVNSLLLDDGVVITNLEAIEDLVVNAPGVTAPPIELHADDKLTLVRATISDGVLGAIDGSSNLVLGDQSMLDNGAVDVAAGATLLVQLTGASAQLNPTSIGGAGESQILLASSSGNVAIGGNGAASSSFSAGTMTRFFPGANAAVQNADCNALFDQILLLDATATFNVTLPAMGAGLDATVYGRGRIVILKTIGNPVGVITVAGAGATIDGAANITLTELSQCVGLLADEQNNTWRVLWSYFDPS